MAKKDEVSTDIRGNNKPVAIKRQRPKSKSNLALIKQTIDKAN